MKGRLVGVKDSYVHKCSFSLCVDFTNYNMLVLLQGMSFYCLLELDCSKLYIGAQPWSVSIWSSFCYSNIGSQLAEFYFREVQSLVCCWLYFVPFIKNKTDGFIDYVSETLTTILDFRRNLMTIAMDSFHTLPNIL